MQMISIVLQKASGKTVYLPFFGTGLGFPLVISGPVAKENERLTLEFADVQISINNVLHYIISKMGFESTGKLDMYLSFQGLVFPFPLEPQLKDITNV